MKRLFIVRHGKSTWDYNSVKDIDRPLKDRGIADGYKMAAHLKKRGLVPEKIISSTGIRALHSAIIFLREFSLHKSALSVDQDLYLAHHEEILDVIYPVSDEVVSLMIFGHNPGFTDLANYLSHLNLHNVPTTRVVVLDFEVDKWTEISRDNLANAYFDFPKNL